MSPTYFAAPVENVDVYPIDSIQAVRLRLNHYGYLMRPDEAIALAERLKAAAWRLVYATGGEEQR